MSGVHRKSKYFLGFFTFLENLLLLDKIFTFFSGAFNFFFIIYFCSLPENGKKTANRTAESCAALRLLSIK